MKNFIKSVTFVLVMAMSFIGNAQKDIDFKKYENQKEILLSSIKKLSKAGISNKEGYNKEFKFNDEQKKRAYRQ